MRLPISSAFSVVALVAATLTTSIATAQVLRTTRVATGLERPVNLVPIPGDPTRLVVTEQWTGNLRVIENGVLLATPFLTVTGLTTGNEQGLLGLAFHPDFLQNGKLYVDFTNASGATILREYTVSTPTDDVANVIGTVQLLSVAQPQANHNGGCLQFGPDGYLYVAMGDGGNGCDTGAGHGTTGNGQSLSTYLGKLLRLDVDSPPSYVPPGNPFPAGAFPLIWSYGLRNPWRFSFDALTGDLYLGDVGQNAVEEIDFEPAGSTGGLNYGWRCFEGNSCSSASACSTSPCACSTAGLVFPIQTYTHATGFAVTGGYVYRGANIPALRGAYFYADYATNRIWSFRYTPSAGLTDFVDRTTQLDPAGAPTITNVTTFGQDLAGELYIVEQSGEIWRIDGVPPGAPNCAGDGSLPLDCPCSNTGGFGRGCANSANPNGAALSVVGDTASDSVRLDASGMPDTAPCIFLAGDAFDANSQSFGDGLLCVSGNLVRMGTKYASGGVARFPEPSDTVTIGVLGSTPPGSGLTAYYQAYYRNSAATFCPPATFNVTSGYQVTW
ncbi:MAG: PQQ-dependent sugar dehydrogenase [Planctomycetes bacterium]|nr:PQQ-dependent sugar dehydrogenase [Planctomycetota bacterium]